MIKKELLKKQLEAFGFPEMYHQKLLTGRYTETLMGRVRLNRGSGLVIVFCNETGKLKKVFDIMDPATW